MSGDDLKSAPMSEGVALVKEYTHGLLAVIGDEDGREGIDLDALMMLYDLFSVVSEEELRAGFIAACQMVVGILLQMKEESNELVSAVIRNCSSDNDWYLPEGGV